MGMDIKAFMKDLDDFLVNDIRNRWKIRHILMAKYLFEKLVNGTPALTEHARKNWQVSVNVKNNKIIGVRYSNRPGDSSGKIPDFYDFENEINKVGKGTKGGGIIWIYNNVKYMQALDDGHSDQAPKNFVANAIQDTRNYFAVKGWLLE